MPSPVQTPRARLSLRSVPIIFQVRRRRSGSCALDYSSRFIVDQHKHMLRTVCRAPYACAEDVRTKPELNLACPNGTDEGWDAFGLSPIAFSGAKGYADLLYSMTDNKFLMRNDTVTKTADFIDSMTEQARLYLLFFAPGAGATSLMTVTADFMGQFEAKVKVKLDHFLMLEGGGLALYVFVQVPLPPPPTKSTSWLGGTDQCDASFAGPLHLPRPRHVR